MLAIIKCTEERNMKTYQSSTKDRKKNFFRRHKSALIVVASVIVVAVAIALSLVFTLPKSQPSHAPTDEPVVDTPNTKVVVAPMAHAEVGFDYALTSLKWWETLKVWKYHPAVDFVGEGDVVAILDGVVKSVENTTLEGTVVTVEHADGYVSIYKSLNSDVAVQAGDTVKAGDKLGTAGTSMVEAHSGAHLHLELKKNGEYVNPFTLLPESQDK